MLTTAFAAVLVPAKLLLTDPRFRIVAWWCGTVAVGYLLVGLRGWHLLRQKRFEIDETRRQIIREQIAKQKSEEDSR